MRVETASFSCLYCNALLSCYARKELILGTAERKKICKWARATVDTIQWRLATTLMTASCSASATITTKSLTPFSTISWERYCVRGTEWRLVPTGNWTFWYSGTVGIHRHSSYTLTDTTLYLPSDITSSPSLLTFIKHATKTALIPSFLPRSYILG